MANERFTDLPTVSNAQFTDIICAVQGYVSPSALGDSVQETLQQVFNLFQSNIILSNAGNPNGALAGKTYQLCWDTTNKILYVCTTTGSSSTAVWTKSIQLTAGTGVTIVQNGNNITISTTGTGVSWSVVTGATQAMTTNNGYVANYTGGGTLVFTLPTTSSVGDALYISGLGSSGWQIAQNAGQTIIIGSLSSTTGVTGAVSSTNQFDSLKLICVTANLTWSISGGAQGNLTIV